MNRRGYLASLGAVAVGSTAGCSGLLERRSSREPPLVEDRPDAVYIPTHIDGMKMIGMTMSGRLHLALSYAWPHRFWLIDGDGRNKVSIEPDDAVHLMVSAWDMKTNTAIPTENPSVTVKKDGKLVSEKLLWRMLSQRMGFHYGDNFALDGVGHYDVEVEFRPVETRKTGSFRDAFDTSVTHSFSFEYDRQEKRQLPFRLLENAGEPGALDPMEMEMMPISQLPRAQDLPGSVRGRGTSGDATLVATVLDERPAGLDGSGPYLALSPRTPYNRYPLPFMALTATLRRGSNAIFDGRMEPTLDPALGFHYGAVIETDEPVESGDTVEISPTTPPQISRHEGYEMAFLDMPPLTVTLG